MPIHVVEGWQGREDLVLWVWKCGYDSGNGAGENRPLRTLGRAPTTDQDHERSSLLRARGRSSLAGRVLLSAPLLRHHKAASLRCQRRRPAPPPGGIGAKVAPQRLSRRWRPTTADPQAGKLAPCRAVAGAAVARSGQFTFQTISSPVLRIELGGGGQREAVGTRSRWPRRYRAKFVLFGQGPVVNGFWATRQTRCPRRRRRRE